LMIPANLSPYYAEPHAMWYRIMSSLAAPTFISLSAFRITMPALREMKVGAANELMIRYHIAWGSA
ncbi:MAG: hypothetical protein ACM3ON_01795, partial [Chloroflexota bacterium]